MSKSASSPTVTVTPPPDEGVVSIAVVEQVAGDCYAMNCVAGGVDKVGFPAAGASGYYIIVDATTTAAVKNDEYTLTVECD